MQDERGKKQTICIGTVQSLQQQRDHTVGHTEQNRSMEKKSKQQIKQQACNAR
jgi:hypothetical protein